MRQKYKHFLTGWVLFIYCFLTLSTVHAGDDIDIFLMYYEEKDLVISSTRHLKPISQIPENITVIHKEEIEDMNAHTVAEVLDRVTGLFVYFHTRDFGSLAQPEIQGSYPRHVLLMVDGFSWGTIYTKYTQNLTIPVQVIERIEIIKGPASSAWGASLGGVINIITKSTGISEKPDGSLKASYGKGDRQDYCADLSGRIKEAGYYIYGGYHYSDPSPSSDPYTNNRLYSKISLPVFDDVDIDLSAGYSAPDLGMAEPIDVLYEIFYPNTAVQAPDSGLEGMISNVGLDTRFITSNLNVLLGQNLNLSIAFNYFDQATNIPAYGMTKKDLVMDFNSEESVTRLNSKVVWQPAGHTLVFGMDYEYGKLNQRLDSLMTVFEHIPPGDLSIEKWAIFTNDTIVLNRFSITSGIRFDYNDIDGAFVSPSLGISCTLSQTTTLKASIARGFTSVPLSFHIKNSWLLPDSIDTIEPETIWAYQTGLEYRSSKFIRFRANLFFYDMDNTLRIGEDRFWINAGGTRCYGTEMEMSTCPVYHLSVSLGTAYVHREIFYLKGTTERYTYNVSIRYDNTRTFNTELYGHFVEWGRFIPQTSGEDDFIWDLNINKTFSIHHIRQGKIYFKIHNLFNGSQYTLSRDGNPKRWMEVGMGIQF